MNPQRTILDQYDQIKRKLEKFLDPNKLVKINLTSIESQEANEQRI